MKLEVEMTEKLRMEPYHGGVEPLMRVRILEKLAVAGGERLGEKSNNTV